MDIKEKALECIATKMSANHILSLDGVYDIIEMSLHNEIMELLEEYENAPDKVDYTKEVKHSLVPTKINNAKIGNIEYSWKSPTKKDEWCGWIKTGFVT